MSFCPSPRDRKNLGRVLEATTRVMDKARDLARTLAAKSPVVMRIGRDSFMRANDNEYRRTIEYVVDTICHIIDTADAQEGLEAFVEKRAPDWS